MKSFFRFPHTPHLRWLGAGAPRDDKVMTPEEVRNLLRETVVVEEKLDGANLGFSLGGDGHPRVQNRGQYLTAPFGGQFSRLPSWLSIHGEDLFDGLDPDLIVFGEWCAARHSLAYDRLPDWWLLFDVFDRRAQRFWSTQRRDQWALDRGLQLVPRLQCTQASPRSLTELLATQPSRFGSGLMEGVVVRREDDLWLLARAKLVRADFTQNISRHWRDRSIEWNRLSITVG